MALNNYLPVHLRDLEEYQQINGSLEVETQALYDNMVVLVNESTIMEASEERIMQWENYLKVEAQGNLYQRKLYVISVIRGKRKLNEQKIKDIVNAYTNGGGADVSLTDSTILVEVRPPNGGEIFLFPDIERTLQVLKPAHLSLIVRRFYATWGIIKDDFNSWNDVKTSFNSWNDVKNYIRSTI